MKRISVSIAAIALLLSGAQIAFAGPIFITGHDPDFHAQGTLSARNLLNAGLSFATNANSYVADGSKFLWVEDRVGDPGVPSVPGGHLIGENGLAAIGLSLGPTTIAPMLPNSRASISPTTQR